MSLPTDLYERITQLVSQNRIDAAMDLLEEHLPAVEKLDPDLFHAVLLLMQDFNDLQERKISGLLVADTEQQALLFRLLTFTRELEDRSNQKIPLPSPDPLRVAQPMYAAMPAAPNTPIKASDTTGGITLGKVVMYTLAALGALVVFFIIMELDNPTAEEGTPSNLTPSASNSEFSDAGSSAALSSTFDEASIPVIFGNSHWVTSDGYQLAFSSDGSAASDPKGSGSLFIDGVDTNTFYGRIRSSDSDGYLGFNLELSENNQVMTLYPFDLETQEWIEEGDLVLRRE